MQDDQESSDRVCLPSRWTNVPCKGEESGFIANGMIDICSLSDGRHYVDLNLYQYMFLEREGLDGTVWIECLILYLEGYRSPICKVKTLRFFDNRGEILLY